MLKEVTVLSVRQPWAWLLVSGIKTVENRSWKTDYPGELYIHAGKTFDDSALREWLPDDAVSQIERHFGIRYGKRGNAVATQHLDEFGAIIGVVTLTGCDREDKSDWDDPDYWHWRVKNARQRPKPIPLRGQLGLFKVAIEVTE
ncbi:MAG: ASCH domain-containing protein [Victivallaceae bacterium]